MNMTAFWVLIGAWILNMVFNIVDAIYRIVTQNDHVVPWDERAVSDIGAFIIELLLLLWLFYW